MSQTEAYTSELECAMNYFSDEEIEEKRINAELTCEAFCLFDDLKNILERIKSIDSNTNDIAVLRELDVFLAEKNDVENRITEIRKLVLFKKPIVIENNKTKKAQELVAKHEARAKERVAIKAASEPVQLALDMWPDSVRGVPNTLLRGALFSIETERSHCLKIEKLESVSGFEIWFKNERWNQTDLDVWEALVHLARLNTDGKVSFKMSHLLKLIDIKKAGSNVKIVNESITRLAGGLVELRFPDEGKVFGGSFISAYYKNEANDEMVVEINPKMKNLYETGYSWIDFQQRNQLGKSALAKWLHGFVSTHKNVHPYKLETLQKLCGSTSEIGEFRRSMRIALEKNKKVGAIASWDIGTKNNKDLVSIVRVKKTSQQKLSV